LSRDRYDDFPCRIHLCASVPRQAECTVELRRAEVHIECMWVRVCGCLWLRLLQSDVIVPGIKCETCICCYREAGLHESEMCGFVGTWRFNRMRWLRGLVLIGYVCSKMRKPIAQGTSLRSVVVAGTDCLHLHRYVSRRSQRNDTVQIAKMTFNVSSNRRRRNIKGTPTCQSLCRGGPRRVQE
jgi:hypothetical protein